MKNMLAGLWESPPECHQTAPSGPGWHPESSADQHQQDDCKLAKERQINLQGLKILQNWTQVAIYQPWCGE